MGVADERLRQVERWFTARGVPQLVQGYRSEARLDARAAPLIGLWLAVATVWIERLRPDGTPDLVGTVIALVVTGMVLGTLLWARKHPPFGTGAKLDLIDIGAIALVPAVVRAVLTASLNAGLKVPGFVLLGVGVIYVAVALGLPELSGWGLRHLRANLPHIAALVARTLPLLLILVVFLLFAAELWQVARALGLADLVAVTALLVAVGVILIVTQAGRQIRAVEQAGWDAVTTGLLADTPAAELPRDAQPPPIRPLRPLERLNLVVLMLISQGVQSLFVALMLTAFLIALGMLAVPAALQETWAGGPVRDLAAFVFLDSRRALSLELVIAATLLGGMCGLYFTGLALTDPTYRAESSLVLADIEQIMAVRSVYLGAAA
jgi:hypothetical protein